MGKHAKTQYKIHKHMVMRWSPRAFADKPVEHAKLQRLFEAARWAASSYNEQPWRFILATKENQPEYDQALACLLEANQDWAKTAPVIVLTAISTKFARNDKPNRVALHDLGLAVGNLTHQATEEGLFVHQMAGVNLDKVRQTYHIPDDFEPATSLVIGYIGEPDILPENLQDTERAPRERKPFSDLVFSDDWNNPSDIFSH